jgi:hypothetical protein
VSLRSSYAVAVLAVAGLTFCARVTLATEVVPFTLEQLVRGASDVVVARVQSAESRWGDETRRWMLTDYTLSIEQNVVGDGPAGGVVKVTYWGGTIDGETQRIAGMELPVIGRRHVLMLRRGWRSSRGSPVVGLDQGLFTVQRDDASGKEIVLDRARRPLQRAAGGVLSVGRASEPGADAVSLSEFAVWISNVPPGPDPAQPAIASRAGDPRILAPIVLRPELPGDASLSAPPRTRRPAEDSRAGVPPPVPSEERTGIVTGEPTPATSDRVGAQYTWSGPASAPIIVNQFPPSFAPWSPEDQYQMGKWNHYAADVFRVFVTPTGTYGWPNGRFDLAGWPSSADTQRVYGYAWEPFTLGITFQRITHQIIEADIALNPAYGWTLDDEWVFDGSSAIGFRQTMIHELGHMWGLEHNFSWLSLMNYFPAEYRAYGLPFSDDAEALRTAHPSRVVGRTDLGVYLFWWNEFFGGVRDTSFPSSVVAGDFMPVNTFHVENAGTTTITNPKLDWYLTSLRSYSGSVTFLGSTTFPVTLPRFFHLNPGSANAFLPVPLGMNGGLYYLNALSTLAGGASQGSFPFAHNGTWSRTRIRVYPALNGLDGGYHAGGSAGDATLYLVGLTDSTGLDVTLESGDPSVVTAPASLHVGPFARQASILLFTNPVSVRREVMLTARSHGKSVSGLVIVLPASRAVLKDKSGKLTELVAVKATFTQLSGGAPLAGVPVTFRIDGDPNSYAVTTSANGVATLKYKTPASLGVGSRSMTAHFAGNHDHAAVTATGTLTLTQASSKVNVEKASGVPGATVNLIATLKRSGDKAPIPGAPLGFTVFGASYTGVTNASGAASVPVTIPAGTPPGSYPVSVSFAGDATHRPGSGVGTLTVK